MDLVQAVRYPFQKNCFVPLLLIPSLLHGALAFCWVGACVGFWIYASQQFPTITNLHDLIVQQGPTFFYTARILFLVSMLSSCVITLWVMGYLWEVQYRLITEGPDAGAPPWKGHMGAHFKAGFHLLLAMAIMVIPACVLILPLGLGMPFVWMPFALASQEKTISAFLRVIPESFEVTVKNYLPLAGISMLGIVLGLLYLFAASLTTVTFVGYPMLCMAGIITWCNLMSPYCSLSASVALAQPAKPKEVSAMPVVNSMVLPAVKQSEKAPNTGSPWTRSRQE